MSSNNENTYKVSLIGASMNTGNMGVSALAASLVKIVKLCKPEATIIFFIGSKNTTTQKVKLLDQTVEIDIVNYRLSPKSSLNKHLFWVFLLSCLQKFIPIKFIRRKIIKSNFFLNELYNSHFIGDIRGGDSFSDIYGIQKFIIASLPSLIALLLKKRLILLPQTYGPYKSTIAKYIAFYTLSRSSHILSRDREGIDFVKKILGNRAKHTRIDFNPDVAFMLDSIIPDKITITPSLDLKESRPLIGLNINGHMYNYGYIERNIFGLQFEYKELMINLIETLINKTHATILCIPHTVGLTANINDPDACEAIINSINSSCKKRVHLLINDEYDQSEIKGVISLCDFFIGSRMHSCIAALSLNIPTIGIAYSKKFIGVFDSIGSINTVLDARHKSKNDIIDKILYYFNKRNEIRHNNMKNIESAQRKIISTFKEITSV